MAIDPRELASPERQRGEDVGQRRLVIEVGAQQTVDLLGDDRRSGARAIRTATPGAAGEQELVQRRGRIIGGRVRQFLLDVAERLQDRRVGTDAVDGVRQIAFVDRTLDIEAVVAAARAGQHHVDPRCEHDYARRRDCFTDAVILDHQLAAQDGKDHELRIVADIIAISSRLVFAAGADHTLHDQTPWLENIHIQAAFPDAPRSQPGRLQPQEPA